MAKKHNINWEKSFYLTAEQVSLLGLDGISVNDTAELNSTRTAARLVNVVGLDEIARSHIETKAANT